MARARSRSEHRIAAAPLRLRPLPAGPVASVSALLALGALALTGSVHGAPPLPPGTLPVPASNFVSSGQATRSVTGSNLTVNQASQRAILNWQSFNIAKGATVKFVQPGASAAALNRIHDANPSVIQGRLSANGQIYLINRNGIVFDRGAQVDAGSLVASTLNIRDEDFQRGLVSLQRGQAAFEFEGDAAAFEGSFIRIEAGAELRTAQGGQVLVFAPRVENNGSIVTPEGQTILAGGAKVYLIVPSDPSLRGFLVEVDPYREKDAGGNDVVNIGGRVLNDRLGKIVAERGNISLAALAVNQSGRATATSSVVLNGSVMLLARDTATLATIDGVEQVRGVRGGDLVLGEGSRTEVLPDPKDRQTIQDAQALTPSSVEMFGKSVRLEKDAAVVVPGGNVKITAQRGLQFQDAGAPPADGVRVYLAPGSRIDMSGLRDVTAPAERNFIEVELRGDELKDAPLQRNGPLRGETVVVDARKGTPLADISAYLEQVQRTFAERAAAGGTLTVRSEGDVILREGSSVDVSGGSIRYLDGRSQTSKLLAADGRIYDIGDAPADIVYFGLADKYVVEHAKWGVTEVFARKDLGEIVPGYIEGRSAGTVEMTAHHVVLDGTLQGRAGTAGALQRDPARRPLGGLLILGDASQSGQNRPDFKLPDVEFVLRRRSLADEFAFDGELEAPWTTTTTVPVDAFSSGGFSRVTVYANGRITLPKAVDLQLGPGGTLSLTGRQVDVLGDAHAPGGKVSLATREVLGALLPASAYGIMLGPGAELDVSGRWVNDALAAPGAALLDALAIHGGSVTLSAAADLILAPGSVIDVSGGGQVDAGRKLRGGNAGSITLASGRFNLGEFDAQTSRIQLDGELRGYAIGRGGELRIGASRVLIGGGPSGAAGELALDAGFFARGGFQKYSVSGQDGMRVAAGTSVAVLPQTLVPAADFLARPSGTALLSFAAPRPQPLELRRPGSLALGSGSTVFGDLVIEPGARLSVDPAGSIALTSGRQLTVLGAVEAPAGSITLSTSAPGADSFNPDQSIWLGADARLLARGTVQRMTTSNGLLRGEVLDGGTVSLLAQKGYVVTEEGALIDVSGTAGALDIVKLVNGREQFARTTLASHAGDVVLQAREGILFDGTLRALPGGAQASGGSLSVAVVGSIRLSYPQGPREIVLREDAGFVPDGLRPGDTIDAGAFGPSPAINGKGFVAARTLRAAGFDDVALRARDAIVFGDDLNLGTRLSLQLDAPVVRLTGAADVRLNSAYLMLANTDPAGQLAQPAAGGDGRLRLAGKLIDVVGQVAVQGADQLNLESAGDIRLRGVAVDRDPGDASDFALIGGLTVAGDLRMAAAQVYPSTLTEFELRAEGAGARIAFEPAAAPAPVLSAGGLLTVRAPVIEQGGVVKAPFGTIELQASESLVLATGSTTSVSGEARTVPFGKTELSGSDYVFDFGPATRIFETLPEKRIVLDAPEVSVQGSVDLSGGGDLYAYEFTAGPGGSRDVLEPRVSPDTYAILPGLDSGFAPHDHQYALGVTGLEPGAKVYLSGVQGLASGVYTLLPARYGLLAGAWLVTPQTGFTDLLPTQTVRRPDGVQIASGYRLRTAQDGSVLRDARTAGFAVRRGSWARSRSEYRNTFASGFFAGNPSSRLPGDAGRLAVLAAQSLALDGAVRAAAGKGRSGAAVDIAAPRLAVVSERGQADPGYLELTVDSLIGLQAQSLLLGGVRRDTAQGTELIAGIEGQRSEILIANDAANPLVLPEILVAATGFVEVADGAAVRAAGEVSGTGGDLRAAGNGALLRLSSGSPITLSRRDFDRSDGILSVGDGASLLAAGSLTLDATAETLVASGAALSADAVGMAAGRVGLGDVPAGVPGLALTPGLLAQLGDARALAIKSYSSIDFYGAVTLGDLDAQQAPVLRTLTLDAAGLAGYGAGDKLVRAAGVELLNSSEGVSAPFLALPDGTGALSLAAVESNGTPGEIVLGPGSITVAGFARTVLTATGEMRTRGTGSLSVGGDLALDAARITAETAADFNIAADGALTLQASPAALETPAGGLGASLAFSGARIDHGGRIVAHGGSVLLRASAAGSDLVLGAGAVVDVGGQSQTFAGALAFAPGGTAALEAVDGDVRLMQGSLVRVAGTAQGGNAGTLRLRAGGTAELDGVLDGGAATGYRGGRVEADLGASTDAGALLTVLSDAGFREEVALRVRTGDVRIGSESGVAARRVRIAADAGALELAGRIDASGPDAGSIELWSDGDLTLQDRARLLARATQAGATGGEVALGSARGEVDVLAGALIDVDAAGGAGGEVLLRAERTADDVRIGSLAGEIAGAAQVVAEAVRPYTFSTLNTAAYSALNADNASFMLNAPAIRARLAPLTNVRPGVEVRSAGNLTVANDWNLFSANRPGGEPGYLTVRAGGDLNVNGSISDGFTGVLPNSPLQSGASWSYRLVSGADLAGADPLALRPTGDLAGGGNFSLAANKLIRTGTGDIRIAAGGDLELKAQSSVIYTAGVPGPLVAGFVNPSLTGVPAPTFPVGGGDVALRAQRDMIAVPSNQLVAEWLYRDVKRNALGQPDVNAQSAWWVRFDQFQQGVGALGGGDVRLDADGDIRNLSAVIPTNGRVGGSRTAAPTAADLVVQGGGDLSVRAGGDIASGLYYVGRGAGFIEAGGSLLAGREVSGEPLHTILAVGDGTLDVVARRALIIETVLDPAVQRQATANLGLRRNASYLFTYAEDSAVHLTAVTGDLALSNNPQPLTQLPGGLYNGALPEVRSAFIYPATLRATSFSANLTVARGFHQFPAARGNLELLAHGSVAVDGTITMSDLDPAGFPRPLAPDTTFTQRIQPLLLDASDAGPLYHADPPLHAGDSEPVRIAALHGDITGPVDEVAGIFPLAFLSKPAVFEAGRDIRDAWVVGQNVDETGITRFAAGRDLRFSTLRDPAGNQRGNVGQIAIGGPGDLIVEAGRSIDLGNSTGILTKGNLNNPFLPERGADIRVSVGSANAPDYAGFIDKYVAPGGDAPRNYLPDLVQYMRQRAGSPDLSEDDALAQFVALTPAAQTEFVNAVLFTELKQTGRDFSRTGNYERGYAAIETLFPAEAGGKAVDYSGDLNLFFSQVKTEQGGDIEMRVPGGLVNAGLANPGSLSKGAAELGIVTVRGGTIRAFVRDDFLVNQSRVFTLQGGDILLWSSEGDIDAGKGAKTASATPPPQIVFRNGRFVLDTSNSISGSGIGVLLARADIEPGDVDLIAPKGTVNAGDAGIRVAGNLNIAALQVIGAENIQVAGAVSGVQLSPGASLAGSLSGLSNVASEATRSAERATQQLASEGSSLGQPGFVPSFITVEVIGLGDEP